MAGIPKRYIGFVTLQPAREVKSSDKHKKDSHIAKKYLTKNSQYAKNSVNAMKTLNRKEIEPLTKRHANAKKPFSKWLKAIKEATWKKHSDIKNTFNSADRFGQVYIFNVGGNNFRAVCIVEFKDGLVHIKEVMTHKQYDKWNK